MTTRVKEIIEYSGLSTRAFAIKCGMNQPTLDRMLKGINSMSLSCISAILNTYPEISSEWLLRGEGQMLKSIGVNQEVERLNKLVDTIATLQDVINDKEAEIAYLTEQIQKFRNQIKK